VVCTAVTDANGNAACSLNVSQTALVVLNLGVTASYAGSANYLAATASAGIL
jgi:hypothetical protein